MVYSEFHVNSACGIEKKDLDLQHIEHAETLPALLPAKTPRVVRRRKEPPKFTPQPGFTPADPHEPPFIPPEELAKHHTAEDAWICVGNRIYDVTAFMNVHPGGGTIIESFAGKQCDWQFERFHAKPQLTVWADRLLVGQVHTPPRNEFPEPERWIKTSNL